MRTFRVISQIWVTSLCVMRQMSLKCTLCTSSVSFSSLENNSIPYLTKISNTQGVRAKKVNTFFLLAQNTPLLPILVLEAVYSSKCCTSILETNLNSKERSAVSSWQVYVLESYSPNCGKSTLIWWILLKKNKGLIESNPMGTHPAMNNLMWTEQLVNTPEWRVLKS